MFINPWRFTVAHLYACQVKCNTPVRHGGHKFGHRKYTFLSIAPICRVVELAYCPNYHPCTTLSCIYYVNCPFSGFGIQAIGPFPSYRLNTYPVWAIYVTNLDFSPRALRERMVRGLQHRYVKAITIIHVEPLHPHRIASLHFDTRSCRIFWVPAWWG